MSEELVPPPTLSDRLLVLRDEILQTADIGDREPPGAEVFDAIVRALVVENETNPGLDHTLHDAITRRLAWGDTEEEVLANASDVCQRLMVAAQRSFTEPADEVEVVAQATQVACAAARIVAQAALGRAGRERAARLREEMGQRRLRDALKRQKQELERLGAGQDGF